MQLHTLTFAAIGPFRDQQRVDFGELAAGGLFLLEGPTGAGKSTVIDALVFALYGDVAGRGSSKARLVSDHRDPAVEPFVELVFETSAGVYRVRRTPEHERPKKRGDGTVTQQASVKLWKATSPAGLDGDPVSTRVGEADAELRDAVGLSREQFVKTVVLPQGEFARFLQSRSDERRAILQSIFGTEHYDRIQDELKRRRSGARQRCDDSDQRLRYAVAAFARTAAPGDDGTDGRATAVTDAVLSAVADTVDEAESAVRAWTAELVDALDAEQRDRHTRSAEAERARDDAAAHLRERQRRRELRDRLRAARAERETLDAERAEQSARERRADAARRAATCRAPLDALDDTRGRLDTASRQVADLRATVELDGLDVTAAGRDEVTRAHRELLDTVVALSEPHQLEAGLADRRDELHRLRRDREKLAETHAEIQARCTALPTEIEALQAEAVQARELAGTLAGLRRDRTAVHELLAVHERLDAARAEQAAAEARCQESHDRMVAADDHVAELRRRYREGVAADLAVALTEGEPCQVCGSTTHPAPATRSDDFVERDRVEQAEQQLSQCRRRLDEHRDARGTAAAKVAELEGRLDGSTAEQLGEQLSRVDGAIGDAETAEHRVGELTGEITRREQELHTSREQHRQAEADIARLDERVGTLAQRLERDEQRVADEQGGYTSVGVRVADLRRRASGAERLAVALGDVEHQSAEHTARSDQLARAVGDAGFDTPEQVRAALLPAADVDALQAEIDAWRRRSDAVDGRLADPDLVGVDADEEIDVDGAGARAEATAAELLELQRAVASGDTRLQQCREAVAEVDDALAERRRVHDEAAAVVRMAGLANADTTDNVPRIALATYVLQRRFEAVVDAANERLADMSSGRYVLESHDGREGGSRRTGLGLRVVDSHTGHARDTGTLSGGETFYVSLALALGLADVVTAEAGGLRMGTLFVDEGFGSLDPDTLDSVMGVLARLRSGGRVVGVVSHVEELKTRIPERIEVRRPTRGGPSTLDVVA
ncbi:exonuclease SbcC [Haloactinopolyspora alba]|uniref:Nuclease SbcCD subunit C n=1 Tax=Haloactinopolyspora alba TaxID=648780 RepID=A0A2P8EG28_9ACTN|nr:SMC family ATPase [Haloactinopolyspora alba]PSL08425.1 exonuclease SbcC [Haloactinopolyspora alba]